MSSLPLIKQQSPVEPEQQHNHWWEKRSIPSAISNVWVPQIYNTNGGKNILCPNPEFIGMLGILNGARMPEYWAIPEIDGHRVPVIRDGDNEGFLPVISIPQYEFANKYSSHNKNTYRASRTNTAYQIEALLCSGYGEFQAARYIQAKELMGTANFDEITANNLGFNREEFLKIDNVVNDAKRILLTQGLDENERQSELNTLYKAQPDAFLIILVDQITYMHQQLAKAFESHADTGDLERFYRNSVMILKSISKNPDYKIEDSMFFSAIENGTSYIRDLLFRFNAPRVYEAARAGISNNTAIQFENTYNGYYLYDLIVRQFIELGLVEKRKRNDESNETAKYRFQGGVKPAFSTAARFAQEELGIDSPDGHYPAIIGKLKEASDKEPAILDKINSEAGNRYDSIRSRITCLRDESFIEMLDKIGSLAPSVLTSLQLLVFKQAPNGDEAIDITDILQTTDKPSEPDAILKQLKSLHKNDADGRVFPAVFAQLELQINGKPHAVSVQMILGKHEFTQRENLGYYDDSRYL